MILLNGFDGGKVRLRLSNPYAESAVTFEKVGLGAHADGPSLVPRTNRRVTFAGERSITVPSGMRVYSDPVDLGVGHGDTLTVSLYAASPTGPAPWQKGSRRYTYVTQGDRVDEEEWNADYQRMGAKFFIDGITVDSRGSVGAVICLGDSITVGVGSSVGRDHSYPAHLGKRMNNARVGKSVLNAGIGGNRLLRDGYPGVGAGDSMLSRLDRDVLTQCAVSDVVVLAGTNDIGLPPSASVPAILNGHRRLVRELEANNINVHAGTLPPFGGSSHYSEDNERKRQAVNDFIRNTSIYELVANFDATIRNPEDPRRIRPEYDSGDHIHPNDAGYQAMAEAIDLHQLR
jgi:lysophospholipase L1-like esterase